VKYRELLRFGVVGGFAFVITVGVNYGLKLTVLQSKPVTALAIATILATIMSYVLSRQWSFNTRGGRRRHHEALLFFAVNTIAIGVNLVPELISRYVLHLEVPEVSRLTQEICDFASGVVIGTLLGSLFRWWGYRTLVFPVANAHRRPVTPRPLRRLDAAGAVRADDRVA
jgi:putative flippase GtrA